MTSAPAALPPDALTAAPLDAPFDAASDAPPLAPALRRSLSPSRASDFLQCPLLYRFRVIDKLPEPPSPAATRGTLVHAVLEQLFDLPPADRTPPRALDLLPEQWRLLQERSPEVSSLFTAQEGEEQWLASAAALLERWFTLEDPTRLAPAERELFLQVELPSGLALRGYVDRLDISPEGLLRVVDYKTGRSPGEGFEAKALFQMRFYALALWRLRGIVPAMLQLVYLGDGQIVRYAPSADDLLATERKVEAIWAAIERAAQADDWRPRRSKLCAWCAHQEICPLFGGVERNG